jgi:hypothetical protein
MSEDFTNVPPRTTPPSEPLPRHLDVTRRGGWSSWLERVPSPLFYLLALFLSLFPWSQAWDFPPSGRSPKSVGPSQSGLAAAWGFYQTSEDQKLPRGRPNPTWGEVGRGKFALENAPPLAQSQPALSAPPTPFGGVRAGPLLIFALLLLAAGSLIGLARPAGGAGRRWPYAGFSPSAPRWRPASAHSKRTMRANCVSPGGSGWR